MFFWQVNFSARSRMPIGSARSMSWSLCTSLSQKISFLFQRGYVIVINTTLYLIKKCTNKLPPNLKCSTTALRSLTTGLSWMNSGVCGLGFSYLNASNDPWTKLIYLFFCICQMWMWMRTGMWCDFCEQVVSTGTSFLCEQVVV